MTHRRSSGPRAGGKLKGFAQLLVIVVVIVVVIVFVGVLAPLAHAFFDDRRADRD